jgi:hypothetical protein
MASVAEFDVLCSSWQNIQELLWTKSEVQEEMCLYCGLLRCKEEIEQLNVEIRRLILFMLDKHYNYHLAVQAALTEGNKGMANLLHQRWWNACQVSKKIASCLKATSMLSGFSGSLHVDHGKHREENFGSNITLLTWLQDLQSVSNLGAENLVSSGGADEDGSKEDDGASGNDQVLVKLFQAFESL